MTARNHHSNESGGKDRQFTNTQRERNLPSPEMQPIKKAGTFGKITNVQKKD